MNEYPEVDAQIFCFTKQFGSIPSSSMSPGDIVLVTGSPTTMGTTGAPILYLCITSGSKHSIYSVSGSYVSQAW